MKRLLSIAMALALALTFMAMPALGDGIYTLSDANLNEPGVLPVAKEKITLSVGITQDSNTTSYQYGENYMTTRL